LAPRGPAGLDFDVFVVDMQPAVEAADLDHLILQEDLLAFPRA
jgi:hypothetical protein